MTQRRRLERRQRQNPDYCGAHYALGSVLQQQGNLDGAIEAFRQALRYAPDARKYTLHSLVR